MENDQRLIAVTRSFARTGKIPSEGEEFLCRAIDKAILLLLQKSIPVTMRLAIKLVSKCRNQSKPLQFESVRALARSAHMNSNYDLAQKHYLEARSFVLRNKEKRAKIDRALVDVYMYLGDYKQSNNRAKLAIATFEALDSDVDVAKTKVNYANGLHRRDRHKEAEKLYGEAANLFLKTNDQLSAARCFYNQANTLVQLFSFESAENLYDQSSKIYKSFGYEKDATDAQWGLAWMHMLKGSFHVALKKLNACEKSYKKMGVLLRVASCELDRAEVFLQLSLYSDALSSAVRAEKLFKKLGTRYEVGKAALFGAYASLSLGKREQALKSARRAKELFLSEDNHAFLGATDILEANAVDDFNKRRELLRLSSKKLDTAQLPLWQAICDINSLGDLELRDPALLRLKKNNAVKEIPTVFAAYHVALGDSKMESGDRVSALIHWKQAANRLDSVRASLPPVELRSSFGRDIRSPHQRLISIVSESDPLAGAIWSERFKTSGLWSQTTNVAATSKERAEVEKHLHELSHYVLAFARNSGNSDSRLTYSKEYSKQVQNIRAQIRQSFIEVEGESKNNSETEASIAESFRKISGKIPIVQYHVGDRDTTCFVHYKGETVAHQVVDGRSKLAQLSAKWSFLLESARLNGDNFSAVDQKSEQKIFDLIGEMFWVPLDIPARIKKILVIPEGQFATLPWAAIKPNGCSLVDRHQIILAPSLRHYINAQKTRSRSRQVTLFVGDTTNLSGVQREKELLADQFYGRVAVEEPCSRESWPEQGTGDIWHYSGHAVLNSQNPFYSSLSLQDGALFAADLRLRQVKLNLVTLAACHSGTQVALPGEESTGFVRSFLEMGARNVLAGHWSVSDKSAVEWMGKFYSELNRGINISEAAQTAALTVKEKYRSAYYWSVFSLFGAGS